MNFRERVLNTVQFQAVDALPFRHAYGLMPGVIDDWHAQGLPTTVAADGEVADYFGFAPRPPRLPLDIGLNPPFETRVLEDTAEHRLAVDSMGRTTRLLKQYASIPLAQDHPVKAMASWQDYRRRLQFTPDRIGADLEEIAQANVQAGHANGFGCHGAYWFPRDLMGDEGLCVAYYEQPELVRDILETWFGLVEQVLAAALGRIRLDHVHFAEDMAYHDASMIGPRLFNEFMKPYYERIHALLAKHDVPIFSVDTDGCVDQLTAWFADCGVNLTGPNEVQAGNDIRAYRRQFGQRVAYFGGLDKRVLPHGRDAIEAMLQDVIPAMKDSGGGWIISLDHRVVRGTTFADFQFYVERVRELARY